MKKPKFLYHGSSKKVDVLMPYQADDWKCEHGRHFGVYATSDRNVALAFALGGIPDQTGTCSRVIREKDRSPLKWFLFGGIQTLGAKAISISYHRRGFVILVGISGCVIIL